MIPAQTLLWPLQDEPLDSKSVDRNELANIYVMVTGFLQWGSYFFEALNG